MGGLQEIGGHCPTCGTEYRPGFDACADDGTRLVPGPAPDPVPQPVVAPEAPSIADGRFVPIAELHDLEPARLLAGRLEAEGIPVRIFPEWRAEIYGRGASPLFGQPVQVMVLESDVPQAQRVLSDIADA